MDLSLTRYLPLSPANGAQGSPIEPVVPQADAPGVREVTEAVRRQTHRDRVQQPSRAGIHHAHRAAKAVGGPELPPVGRDLEHVGGAADAPGGHDPAGPEAAD